jgi:hypothetical protein
MDMSHLSGAKLAMGSPQPDVVGVVVEDTAGLLAFYCHLGLETIGSFDPGYVASSGNWRIDLAFRLDRSSDVDGTWELLAGADDDRRRTTPWDEYWRQRYALIDDPDGNSVDRFAVLPGATT